jgi:hypothetical protein
MKKSLLQFSVCILMGVILLLAGSATAAKAADLEAFRATVEDTWAGQTMTLPGLSRVLNLTAILAQNPMSHVRHSPKPSSPNTFR